MTSASIYSEQEQPDNTVPAAFQETSETAGQPQTEPLSSPSTRQMPAAASNTTIEAASQSGIHLHGHVPAGNQVRVFINQAALSQIDEHANSDLNKEVGGVLMGHLREGEAYRSIEVLAALPAVSDDHGPIHFKFTADAWARIHEDRDDQYPNLQIVGWFHTHPDLGVFYSADDVVVHSAAFVMPWQVGLVLDPIRSEGCLFGWQTVPNEMVKPQLAPINGYYEILDQQAASTARWKLLRSNIWQESYQPYPDRQYADQPARDLYLPKNEWPALPPISPWWGVLLGGLSLFISLLLLLERLLAAGG